MGMKAGLAVISGLAVLGIAGFAFVKIGQKPKYAIGDIIDYCGTQYLVIDNTERGTLTGELYYQLQPVGEVYAIWRKVSDVDAGICVA